MKFVPRFLLFTLGHELKKNVNLCKHALSSPWPPQHTHTLTFYILFCSLTLKDSLVVPCKEVEGRGKIIRRKINYDEGRRGLDFKVYGGKCTYIVYCICTTLDYNAFPRFVYNRVRK